MSAFGTVNTAHHTAVTTCKIEIQFVVLPWSLTVSFVSLFLVKNSRVGVQNTVLH